jgi:hypothetical protein
MLAIALSVSDRLFISDRYEMMMVAFAMPAK